jgi:cytochrome c oxidase subunit 4
MAHGHGHGHLHHRAGPAALQEATFHVHPPMLYVKTLLGLVALMILTVWASFWHFPDFSLGFVTVHGTMINNIIAMAIAIAKALLVLMFFMGLKYATKLTKLWAVAGFVGFALMFLVFGDYSTRKYEPTPRWNNDPGSALQRSVHESRTDEDFRKLDHPGRF